MKKTVLALFLLFVWNASASADVPKYISFQGELTDSQGTRITTSKSVDFEIFNDAGVSVWGPENQTLIPANGIVSTRLGITSALNIAFDTQYWLKVTVAGEAMSPKIRLTTSPYAFIAKYLDTGAAAYGALSVAETVTANKFVGNGSLLTGITASSSAPDTDWNMTGGTSGNLYRLSGNVGIGTASPTDSLHVVGPMRVMQSNATGTFVIGTNGNVGIGTVTPGGPLQVIGTAVINGDNRSVIDVVDNSSSAASVGGGISFGGKYNSGGSQAEWAGIKSIKANGTDGQYGAHMAFVTRANGSLTAERMRITDVGNVGIGTTSPADSLHVAGRLMLDTGSATGASDGAIRWSGSDFQGRKGGAWVSLTDTGGGAAAQPDTDWTMTATDIYRASGKVGIGTTSPSDSLTVNGSFSADTMAIGDTLLVVTGTGEVGINKAPTTNVNLEVYSSGDAQMWLRSPNSGMKFQNWGGMNFIQSAGAGMSGAADLLFTGMNGAPEHMRIKASGNIGVGTTAPSNKLEMVGSANTHLKIQNNTSGSDAGIRLENTVGSGREYIVNSHSSGYFDFYDLTAAKSRMTINSSGNVGIGTTTPGDSLHVRGGIIADTLTVGDTVLVVNKNSGNVGIGTTAPGQQLEISKYANAALGPVLRLRNTGNNQADKGGIQFATGNTTDGSEGRASILFNIKFGGEGEILFNTGTTAYGTEVMRITTGNVGIGTTTPTDSLTVNGSIRIDSTTLYVDPATNRVGIGTDTPTALLTLSGGANSDGNTWNNASSREYKDGIEDLSASEAKAAVAALQPKKYVYKNSRAEPRLGFIAEDVPDLVAMNDRKSLSSMDLVAALTKVVQDQQAQIEALTEKVEALEGAR